MSNLRKTTLGQKSCRHEQPKQHNSAHVLCKFPHIFEINNNNQTNSNKIERDKEERDRVQVPEVDSWNCASSDELKTKNREIESKKKRKNNEARAWVVDEWRTQRRRRRRRRRRLRAARADSAVMRWESGCMTSSFSDAFINYLEICATTVITNN